MKKETPIQGAIEVLINTGVISLEEAKAIHTVRDESILDLLIHKKAILVSEIEDTRVLLSNLNDSSHTRRMQAQLELVALIANSYNRRIEKTSSRMEERVKAASSASYPSVAEAIVGLGSED